MKIMGSHILSLYTSSQASKMKRLTAYVPMNISRFGHWHGTEERAPSTAEEFKRVAEEKSRREVTSQTVEEAQDGVEEATVGDSELESVKERYKEPPGKGNFHKTGDE
ncbi:Hypothetical predicted protein [Olea europaea subsp. europaea]|uniref:Uncharacterized protein n=1 Tax=Olea europaea subsp. europaea TaxID=158383 RepID=A0A8S0Q501_OLEEU|nr:Hypothetical predicted protein [Olea europaea subsp. europaea]